MARLISPTLGPLARTVMVAPITSKSPEVLDDGGLIARRIIQLVDRNDDVGAMFLRRILWEVYEQTGDGVATACVVFKAAFDDGLRCLAAGVDAEQLRDGLHHGLEIILGELNRLTQPVASDAMLRHVAQTACPDAELASAISDLLSVSGMYGHIEVRETPGTGNMADFIDGAFWKSPVHALSMLANSPHQRVDIERCLIFGSDVAIEDDTTLRSMIHFSKQSGAGGLIIVAKSVAESCVHTMLTKSDTDFRIVSVQTPDLTQDIHLSPLRDLEALAGGRAFHEAAGDSLRSVRIEDLGRARYVWADRAYFGIVRAGGDPSALRDHLRELKTICSRADDLKERQRLTMRISRLSSSTAVLWTSAANQDTARRTISAVRDALRDGVVPGAGSAFLACRSALHHAASATTSPAMLAAYQILKSAIEAPARTMIENAGKDASLALHTIQEKGDPYGWDGHTNEIVDVMERGIVDPSNVTKVAIRAAVRGAAQALTIGTLVHRSTPELAIHP